MKEQTTQVDPATIKPRKGFSLNAITDKKSEQKSPFQPAPEPIPGTEQAPRIEEQASQIAAASTTRAQMLARRTSLTRIAAHLGFEKPEYLAVLLNLFDVYHRRNLDERADAMTELRNHLAEIAEMGGIPQ